MRLYLRNQVRGTRRAKLCQNRNDEGKFHSHINLENKTKYNNKKKSDAKTWTSANHNSQHNENEISENYDNIFKIKISTEWAAQKGIAQT